MYLTFYSKTMAKQVLSEAILVPLQGSRQEEAVPSEPFSRV